MSNDHTSEVIEVFEAPKSSSHIQKFDVESYKENTSKNNKIHFPKENEGILNFESHNRPPKIIVTPSMKAKTYAKRIGDGDSDEDEDSPTHSSTSRTSRTSRSGRRRRRRSKSPKSRSSRNTGRRSSRRRSRENIVELEKSGKEIPKQFKEKEKKIDVFENDVTEDEKAKLTIEEKNFKTERSSFPFQCLLYLEFFFFVIVVGYQFFEILWKKMYLIIPHLTFIIQLILLMVFLFSSYIHFYLSTYGNKAEKWYYVVVSDVFAVVTLVPINIYFTYFQTYLYIWDMIIGTMCLVVLSIEIVLSIVVFLTFMLKIGSVSIFTQISDTISKNK